MSLYINDTVSPNAVCITPHANLVCPGIDKFAMKIKK